ncbi:hypothetical protein [Mucilaginibacter polytrichastri]|uniref:CHAT domain-containing protein n=1 Tax=Mucilaginibacter polytrichastri TaxID=1302689 RepID=A0A1Q5ZS42_9SPHI|nr:hypothetical protein [Mucilaginibacter polytrichastri]OKS84584.1 hypothetical protein RG47T_0016 [Mucilaginibacter polytrichastri]SFT02685.1 hypothetical protein SAMN04487890_108219 [Mucilaginibacter polytrichastri]
MLSLRPNQITQIHYLLITEKDNLFIPFIPPMELEGPALDFIRCLPKDILQIDNPVNFFENAYRLRNDNPYRLNVLYHSSLIPYLENSRRNIIRLYMINTNILELDSVLNTLMDAHQPLSYYFFFNKKDDQPLGLDHEVSDPGEFLRMLYAEHQHILELIGAPDIIFHPHVDVYSRDFYDFPIFVPAQNNYHLLNSIIGNFKYGPGTIEKSKEEIKAEHEREFIEAQKAPYSFGRLKTLIRSTRKIDKFFELMREHNIIKPVHEIETMYSPLVIIAPYQNPDLVKLDRSPASAEFDPELINLLTSMDFEQTQNYINSLPPMTETSMRMVMQVTLQKIKYLDSLGALHASFAYSPVIRLPFQGKTLNQTLSAFDASQIDQYADHETRKILKETISKFGSQLAERTLSPGLKAKLLVENRQIVAITDLPIEWLETDGVPLSFTHDICRLPETALHGLMSSFAANEHFIYTVPKDILKKTLVIFGSNEMELLPWRYQVKELAKTHEFVTEVCLSVAAAVKAFRKHKPDLLIFDCHGGYNSENKTSFLMLGDEQLTGPLVVLHDISAPLVFLCACNTAPTYGTINTIANAFFENHCLSVTTTYLPIAIDSSSTLYLRLLNNLRLAATDPIHPNWLSFLSHMIRTSYISDTFRQSLDLKPDGGIYGRNMQAQANAYNRSMLFHQRRKIYSEEADKHPNEQQVIPEYLFYSNLGRSDLIHFGIYMERFNELNNIKGHTH